MDDATALSCVLDFLKNKKSSLMETQAITQGSTKSNASGHQRVIDWQTVSQALEIARESPGSASDPTIVSILEAAIGQVCAKISADPDSCILNRDEFAVFNYFQYRFVGNKIVMAARTRYWKSLRDAPSPGTCSESSMTELSSSADLNIATRISSSKGVQAIVGRLLGFFNKYIDYRLGIIEAQQRGRTSSGGSRPSQGPKEPPESQGQRSQGKEKEKATGKRALQTNDGSDESGDAPDDEVPEAKRNKADQQKIACPYMKRFPAEFGTWRTWVGPGFDGMHRVKEHLKRRHFKENVCQRCGLHLESYQALQEHLRSLDNICPVREIQPQMGFMTQMQWEMISKKRQRHTTPLLARWKEFYLILFPDADEDSIPSPYFEACDTPEAFSNVFDPLEYEGFLKKHLPGRILAKIADMLQEESLEVLKAYVLQKSESSSQKLDKTAKPSEVGSTDLEVSCSGLFDTIERFEEEGNDTFDFSFLESHCQHPDKGEIFQHAAVDQASSVV
ncbi:unnamed protein product [Colletotrichum noveboracense]|uniref:C2H2-type domain-containing protein n=1 Tax=Colletotrichum noveboracense TaxID=2664923 RepID=A0A9W4RJB2_9PEZI|nr:unnamed protein product [Colletotrichum noveboracense]